MIQADSQGLEKPIAYYFKKMNRHQQRYSIIEKEALALVLVIQHFEFYMAGSQKELSIIPLSSLRNLKRSTTAIFRWSLVLQPYNLVIQHLPGKLNAITDTFSRG